MFNAFGLLRAVSTTPEDCLGASTEHLPEACCLRALCRGSGSSFSLEATPSSLSATDPGLAAAGLPSDGMLVPLLLDTSRHHAGNRATLSLSASRGGLLSSHEERAAFHGAHKVELVLIVRQIMLPLRVARRLPSSTTNGACSAEFSSYSQREIEARQREMRVVVRIALLEQMSPSSP